LSRARLDPYRTAIFSAPKPVLLLEARRDEIVPPPAGDPAYRDVIADWIDAACAPAPPARAPERPPARLPFDRADEAS
jgi:hypothetical protein